MALCRLTCQIRTFGRLLGSPVPRSIGRAAATVEEQLVELDAERAGDHQGGARGARLDSGGGATARRPLLAVARMKSTTHEGARAGRATTLKVQPLPLP